MLNKFNQELGQKLKFLRLARGNTTKNFAITIDCQLEQLENWENGICEIPVSFLYVICNKTLLNIAFFFEQNTHLDIIWRWYQKHSKAIDSILGILSCAIPHSKDIIPSLRKLHASLVIKPYLDLLQEKDEKWQKELETFLQTIQPHINIAIEKIEKQQRFWMQLESVIPEITPAFDRLVEVFVNNSKPSYRKIKITCPACHMPHKLRVYNFDQDVYECPVEKCYFKIFVNGTIEIIEMVENIDNTMSSSLTIKDELLPIFELMGMEVINDFESQQETFVNPNSEQNNSELFYEGETFCNSSYLPGLSFSLKNNSTSRSLALLNSGKQEYSDANNSSSHSLALLNNGEQGYSCEYKNNSTSGGLTLLHSEKEYKNNSTSRNLTFLNNREESFIEPSQQKTLELPNEEDEYFGLTESLTQQSIEKTVTMNYKKAESHNLTDYIENVSFIYGKRYSGFEKLGEGTYGEVYKAYDEFLQRSVAFKFARNICMDPKEIERFLLEMQVLAQLNHPNIIRIFDAQIHKGKPFYIMECQNGANICSFFAGERAENKTKKDKQFILQVCSSFVELVDALVLAHEKDIYHQDIKPENILVSKKDNYHALQKIHQAKLLDFGLARIGKDTVGSFAGTIRYSAPERFYDGFKPNASSDIYSIGAVLYETLTGRYANLGEGFATILESTRKSKTFMSEDNIDFEVQKICLKCMDPNPQKRYQKARDLQLALLRHIAELEKIVDWPYLVMQNNRQELKIRVPLTKRNFYIGRSFSSDLIVDHPSVSRLHVGLKMEENSVFIENIGGKNPIVIENRELHENKKSLKIGEFPEKLRWHDEIKIGKCKLYYVPNAAEREKFSEEYGKESLEDSYEETCLETETESKKVSDRIHKMKHRFEKEHLQAELGQTALIPGRKSNISKIRRLTEPFRKALSEQWQKLKQQRKEQQI